MAASNNGDAGSSKQLMPLLRQIETSRNSEQEWDVFESQFRALHPEFMDRMAQAHPDLSPTELKVCALLKINLATKEVANILCCSTRTIEDHRYRIRNKLKLAKGTSLVSYLMGVS
jgi:DNA-binding CsgD family transcriptional regulator